MSFKKILIAVDESAFAAHAADVGIELAKALKAKVGLIHVFDPSVGPGGAIWGEPADRLAHMSEQAAKNLLAGFRKRTAVRSDSPDFVEASRPASKIIDAARNWPTDLIVMGSHGRGKIHGLLESVSHEVLHHTPCPVLVVGMHT